VDGRTVRTGRLFRANALNRLSDADIATVGKLGLACVIDFRHAREIELVGVDRLPPGPRLVPMPVFDPDHDVFTAVSAVLRGLAGEDALVHLREDAQTAGPAG
jgi:protein-tyrosine phosphatase